MISYTLDMLNLYARLGKLAIERFDSIYEDSLLAAAQNIAKTADTCPIILLAGPSGSGKTTTAHKLEKYLDDMGHEAHTVPMDNYFYRRDDGVVPLDEEGRHDLESPLNLDMELFARHTAMMAEGKAVDMPTFDFANQRRSNLTVPVKRKKGEIIIFEGIHALNPQVLPDQSFSRRIYICPDVEVELEGGNITQQQIRLLRRLMRDKTHRGSSFEATLGKYRSVCRGERLYIDPYKDSADIFINTFMSYELNVYASCLRGSLSGMDKTLLRETGADRLMELLELLVPVAVQDVSPDALIQEFLGNS
ncbi:MAG: nucleoside kinase [Clostridia bacterium]|nr:nucleoside kinase [Clostridia bacterium]MBR5902755.1 nucleoside kinase [Clostridia bacterium]